MTERMVKEILEQKIEAWKNKLIDLSRRNPLLNFKATKVTTIKIIDELPTEVFKSMVVPKAVTVRPPGKTGDRRDSPEFKNII